MVTSTRRALPALRRLLPRVLGLAVVIIAVANLIDVVWPGMAHHFEVLARLVPQWAAPWAHALAGPVAVLLIGVGWALTQRRRAALAIAVGLLGVMAVTMAGERRAADAAAYAAFAVLLYLARGAFPVMPAPAAIRNAMWRAPFAAAGAFTVGILAVLVARTAAVPEISGTQVLTEAMALLMWRAGPADFPATFHWLPQTLALVGIIAVVVVIAPLVRRPPMMPDMQTSASRRRVDDLASRHDSGSLSSFLLRDDHHWLFSDDRNAVLAYRVEAGVLLVAADPIGDPRAVPGLVRKAADIAERHGLLLGVVAGHADMRALWREVGLRARYLGDEAVVQAASFSLEGRFIRKVRQSVTRLEREGYTAALVRVRDLGAEARADLEQFRSTCRGGRGRARFLDGAQAHRGPRQSARVGGCGSRPRRHAGRRHALRAWGARAYAVAGHAVAVAGHAQRPDGVPCGARHHRFSRSGRARNLTQLHHRRALLPRAAHHDGPGSQPWLSRCGPLVPDQAS